MNKFETAIEILKDEFEGAKVASENYARMVIMLAEAQEAAEVLKAEYEAHTDELQKIIDSNEYKLRTVWYKGKEWASIREVDAACRADADMIRARRSA